MRWSFDDGKLLATRGTNLWTCHRPRLTNSLVRRESSVPNRIFDRVSNDRAQYSFDSNMKRQSVRPHARYRTMTQVKSLKWWRFSVTQLRPVENIVDSKRNDIPPHWSSLHIATVFTCWPAAARLIPNP